MNKDKILIIGGAGFIGGNLSLRLLEAGFDLRILTRSGRSIRNISNYREQVELIFGDFMDDYALRSAIKGVDKVVHLVSTTFPGTSLDSGVYDISSNLIPTLKLLEICKELDVKNIIYASSGGTIYGEPEYNPIDEQHPLNPKSMYGHSKKVIESYMTFFANNFGMNIQVLRISNPFGPFQNIFGVQGLIAVAFGCLIENRTFIIYGKGDLVRDYIYIEDVISAFVKALDAKNSQVVNISRSFGSSIVEVLDIIERVTKRKLNKKFVEERRGDVRVNILDNTKAKKMYDWSPEYTFEQGISETWKWLRSFYN